ncbi:fungal chitosanase of glycosyl hydrolase group 75-domain-containing protein [Mycena albidolilacea]|uniref:Endo-chitosanase n=1 Tax=Mycena albidolilacea TaxID=1033008 RepID=A0AAD7ED64_9AGAR|nr:fungal chitosanase of glycosyl hydrolase group 75-domain-containing protein [Mycena albidolilacea]
MRPSFFFFLSFSLISFTLAAPTSATNFATKDTGFSADLSIDVAGILSAAQAATADSLASFPHNSDAPEDVEIFGDWANLPGVSAFHFFADMDVDCDGSVGCSGDGSEQSETSFGHLDASKVPFFVLPADFVAEHGDIIHPNAVGAIICGGKMVYGIFGDANGATPQVIGEGSLLLAQTCFPNDGLNGNNGHEPLDVLYIVFGTAVAPGVKDETIDIDGLKAVGDEQVGLLQAALQL